MPDTARLGIDWGAARIGVAAAGAHTTLAYPVETVATNDQAHDRLAAIVEEYNPAVIYIGLPIDLKGRRGIAAQAITEQAAALAGRLPDVEVRLVDERLSTAAAARGLSSAGKSSKSQRRMIDQAAASVILQDALDAEERTGHPVGELVEAGVE